MAGTGRQGLLQLSRRADQQSGAWYVPLLGHQTLATIAQAAQSERWNDLGEDHPVSQRLVPQTAHSSSMAGNTLRRHSPKVGAVCGKAACTVLCGGRSAMSVPTAIAEPVIGRAEGETRWRSMTASARRNLSAVAQRATRNRQSNPVTAIVLGAPSTLRLMRGFK